MAERSLDALGQDEVIPLRAVVGSLGADAVAFDFRNVPVERALDAALAPRLQGATSWPRSRSWRGDQSGHPLRAGAAGAKL